MNLDPWRDLVTAIEALPPLMVRLEIGDTTYDAFATGQLIPDALTDLVPRWAPTGLGPEVRILRALHPCAWQAIDSDGAIMAGGRIDTGDLR